MFIQNVFDWFADMRDILIWKMENSIKIDTQTETRLDECLKLVFGEIIIIMKSERNH